MLMRMVGTCIYGVLVIDGYLCSQVYGIPGVEVFVEGSRNCGGTKSQFQPSMTKAC